MKGMTRVESRTLLETKSTTTSTLELEGFSLDAFEEIFFHSSLNVDGTPEEDCESSVEGSTLLLLNAQFLPLMGNTTNLALIIDFPQLTPLPFFPSIYEFSSITPSKDSTIKQKSVRCPEISSN